MCVVQRFPRVRDVHEHVSHRIRDRFIILAARGVRDRRLRQRAKRVARASRRPERILRI